MLVVGFALVGQQLTTYHLRTFDAPAYVVDSSFGTAASATLAKILWSHPLLHQSFGTTYGWLPATVSVCYALDVRAGNREAGVLRNAALAAGAIALLLYRLNPAAGPIYAFGAAFPDALPDPSTLSLVPTVLAVPSAPRNCVPSVHFAWALLAAVEARRLARAWRVAFALFAALIAMATIGLEEHYLIDLVVALPFTLSIYAICSRLRARAVSWRSTAMSGALATLSRLVFLRLAPPLPHLPLISWSFTVATMVGTIVTALGYFPEGSRRWPSPYCLVAPAFVRSSQRPAQPIRAQGPTRQPSSIGLRSSLSGRQPDSPA
ncbi:MAG TPA: phosphatase PAP2 family protein [Stellaceae bacterium]|nr:phosphatase PAP2 family protein [Stellaceae bacterium]